MTDGGTVHARVLFARIWPQWLKLESFAILIFTASLDSFTASGVVTAVKIERCAIHVPPPSVTT